jgi:(p)ppGpp synthase/HD superfamily hydrolase
MDIKVETKSFAIKAHKGQVRRSDPTVPAVIHPIMVAKILKKAGCDDNVIAAGYLHDTFEDGKITFKEIFNRFGPDIAYLVFTASERNPLLSWEERKELAIDRIRTKPLRNKYVVCADKISNITSLIYEFREKGFDDWSLYKVGRDKQLWFFSSVYQALIEGENQSDPLFETLKDLIEELKRICGVDYDRPKVILLHEAA